MSFVPKNALMSGAWAIQWHIRKASTAISVGAALVPDLSVGNTVIPATASTKSVLGISMTAVAATDSDYATAGVEIPLLCPTGSNSIVIATTAGSATGLEGKTADLTNSLTVNEAATSVKIFQITKFLTATSVEGYFVSPALTA